MPAAEHLSDESVLQLLDYPAYFELLGLNLPENRKGILERLAEDDMIIKCEAGFWNITNLGAILFAKRLEDFNKLKRKAVRLVVYKDHNRLETLREQGGTRGYAAGFEGLLGLLIIYCREMKLSVKHFEKMCQCILNWQSVNW